jgi:S1-C subfamily serine protease
MNFRGRILLVIFLALPALATEKITQATIDGQYYSQIQDVHIVSGGRVVILFGGGGITVTPDKLSQQFLDSWGITSEQLTSSKQALERESQAAIDQAIAAGYFREVDGVVYDLRKPQGDWTPFSGAKIMQVAEDGALVNTTPTQDKPSFVYIRNLPKIYTDNQLISVTAKADGTFSFLTGDKMEHTIRAYDIGRPLQKNEIPPAMLKQGLAAVLLPSAYPRRPRSFEGLPGESELRAIGSGFFVTKDGYLLTNFHVVKDADHIEVKAKDRTVKAEVVEVDKVNDLALLKVSGTGFHSLRLSHRSQADLGESVFTIGFPNIETQGMAPKYTDGKISSLAGMLDDPGEYQISVPVQPGNSGGPLCDNGGEVVGVIVARLNDLAMLRSQGVLPQNVNYAIKAQSAERLLRRVADIDASLAKDTPSRSANVVQSVEDAVAMIMIY